MIKRKAQPALLRLAGQFSVIAVTGPRQSGKSTLVRATFPEKQYISLDDTNNRELASSNPRDFLSAFPQGVIIDEAQKAPELFAAIKMAVDEGRHEPGKYILTGSSQFRLRENISDSLAGRVGMLRLLPLSIEELKEAGLLSDDPYEYVFNGFYPPLYDSEKAFIRDDWFESYIETYLDIDIRGTINPSNINFFRKLLQICAVYSGQMVNYDEISRELGVSSVTVKSWMSALEASYIIHFLEPDTDNLGKSVVKTPKLYFIDPGLMCYLLRLDSREELLLDKHKGAAVETMAVSELLKARYNEGRRGNLTFFRDRNGFEVDIIADWKRSLAVEVKSNSDSEKKLSANVRKYVNLRTDETKGFVFYLGELTAEIDGINYVSWKDWSLNA